MGPSEIGVHLFKASRCPGAHWPVCVNCLIRVGRGARDVGAPRVGSCAVRQLTAAVCDFPGVTLTRRGDGEEAGSLQAHGRRGPARLASGLAGPGAQTEGGGKAAVSVRGAGGRARGPEGLSPRRSLGGRAAGRAGARPPWGAGAAEHSAFGPLLVKWRGPAFHPDFRCPRTVRFRLDLGPGVTSPPELAHAPATNIRAEGATGGASLRSEAPRKLGSGGFRGRPTFRLPLRGCWHPRLPEPPRCP